MTARSILLLAGACLACLPPAPARADAQHDPQGLWTGQLVTDRGNCSMETTNTSTLQIGAKQLTFTPADGSLALVGIPAKAATHYHAEALVKQPSGAPFPMVFEARPEGDTMVGTYGTPRCRAHIVLKR
ncbi:hypothetical protein LU298_15625 [Komagataeibacter intermedius]|uniref:Uncharacterized protein n=2 Tax=Komagataeibacter intermedius TaxID=66229 RepID=A0A0N1N3U9_9PROT|nr:hypothetical protein [Komagataeibacter intermedius]KPH85282.1 hypothetical protein GLUCOINTEAF2_0201164 [Komagataeibacter intermedius AF2]MCF3637907.1 hypothetical protein [Komagataeibacter intermedius]GAN86762.1 hypothetical protein Gain_0033_040 [Komagataeibacter intermedius TF2]GBQ66660.1 hypothetical protein AA0521_0800 [Komagataeibacter intermedius NRIC 0521]